MQPMLIGSSTPSTGIWAPELLSLEPQSNGAFLLPTVFFLVEQLYQELCQQKLPVSECPVISCVWQCIETGIGRHVYCFLLNARPN